VSANNAVGRKSIIPPFSPIADGDLIPVRPFAAIASGSARGVPLIVGSNLEEMKLYRFLDPAIDALDRSGLVDRCSALFPGSDPEGHPLGRRVAEVYQAERKARGDDASPAETWLAISTDHLFRAGTLKLAELQSSHAPEVFVYQFAWKGTTPGKPQGAVHGLEVPFVFGTLDVSEIGAIAGRTQAARALSECMQDAWLAFARTGRPRSSGLPDWPAYAAPRRATLELGERSVVRGAPQEAERALWEGLIG
jgi:para-nitrobenzyl esterase